MDTKLRHKRSKKIKTRNEKGNGDVLVVPPDILKKLGISIGNTVTKEISSNINTEENIGTVYNDNTSISNDEQSSEASILETANLMKKSVFLSPTFVATVANAIPGEIEITSNKNFFEPLAVKNLSLNSVEVKEIDTGSITVNGALQEDNINLNDNQRNLVTVANINRRTSRSTRRLSESNHTQVPSYKETLTKKQKKLKSPVTQTEFDVTVNAVNITEFSQHLVNGNPVQTKHIESNFNSSEISDIQIKQAENDLISLGERPIQIDPTEVANHLISLEEISIQIEKTKTENNLISLNETAIQLKGTESIVFVKPDADLENHIEVHNNLNLLEINPVHIGTGEVENQLTSLKGTATQVKDVEPHNNVISLESVIQIEPADNIIPLQVNTDLENQSGLENNPNSVEENSIQVNLTGNDNHISIGETPSEINQTATDSNFLSLEGSIIDMDQAENIVYLEKNNIIELKPGTSIQLAEKDVISLEEANIQIEEENVVQNICENYLKNFLTKDGKLDLRDNNINYDLSEEGIISSLPIVNEDFPNLSVDGILVHTENSTDKQPVIDMVILNNSEREKDSCLKDLPKQNNGQILGGSDISYDRKKQDLDAPANKIAKRVNIISEEIISPVNLNDLSRSRSPVIRALTPVPLNTVIVPKQFKSNGSYSDIKVQNNPTKKVNTTDLLNSDTYNEKTENIFESRNDQANFIALNVDELNSKTSTLTNNITDLADQVIIDKHLGNKNDISTKKEIETVTNNSKRTQNVKAQWNETSSLKNENSSNLNKFQNDNNNCKDKLIGKKEINSIRHAYLTLTQNHPIQNYPCIENKQNSKESKQAFDKNSTFDEKKINVNDNILLKNELKADNKKATDLKRKSKKKKKKTAEDASISEKTVNDSENKDEKINNILESSKENSNTTPQIDKVKEIAEYIKKIAQMYKDKKKIVSNHKKATDNKKEAIHSKSNTTKSKLCIQGVEKPGGTVSDELKTLKTYGREKKKSQISCSSIKISDRNDTVAIVDTAETELNSINISTSHKQRDFCLCSDFGRLNTREYDNSYEHIHFWHRNSNSDIDAIFNIYDDDTVIYKDRTELDDVIIIESADKKTDSSYICWNFFLNDADYEAVETYDEMYCCVDERGVTNSKVNEVTSSEIAKEIDTELRKCGNKVKDLECSRDTHKCNNMDIQMNNDGNDSYEVVTIIEIADGQNNNTDTPIGVSDPTIGAECNDTKNNNVDDNNLNTDTNKPGTSKSTMKIVKVEKNTDKNKRNNLKRNLSARQSSEDRETDKEPSLKKNIKCGVCNQLLSESEWDYHVTKKHYGIGWKAGNSFDVDDPILAKKLKKRLQNKGSLKCPVCYIKTAKLKKILKHLKICIINPKEHHTRNASQAKDTVTCGVCQKNVEYQSWIEHIKKHHNYLAWFDGQDVLDLEDEAEVLKHLYNIIKLHGSLVCHKCGLSRKRGKNYLEHVQTCDGSELHFDDTSVNLNLTNDSEDTESTDKKVVKCGVCETEVPVIRWNEHIGREHNYLAWEHGSTPLNVDDEEAVWKHLQQFIRHYDGLLCYKCGLKRRRVKLYLSHINTCDGEGVNFDEDRNDTMEESDQKIWECGVCQAMVPVLEWNEHIGKQHNYLAWRVGNTLDLNDEDAVKEHLLHIIRNSEGLLCYKCGLVSRRAKVYLAHVKTCGGSENRCKESTSGTKLVEIKIDVADKAVKCGVCDQEVSMSMWINHIQKEHRYLAWIKGENPLNVDDEDEVKAHLIRISRECNGLVCNKCGIVKKYPKCFLFHVQECTVDPDAEEQKPKYEPDISSFDISDVTTETVMCGVCNKEIKTSDWLQHIDDDHDYIAWLVDRPPLDTSDTTMIQRHLNDVSKTIGGLKCKKCGLCRKHAKAYLQHVKDCGIDVRLGFNAVLGKDPVDCAVCLEKVEPKDWRDHAMKKHYNVAWIVGGTPIEINNPYGVEPYIKQYQSMHNNKLVCQRCGITRISAVGFYAHIITCGKTEEEMEVYKNICDICNCKYLCIYKSQHMTMHREQEYAQERKILMAMDKQVKREERESCAETEVVGGRRKAAEKAKTVIEKYTSNKDEDGIHCPKCGFTCETESEMSDHVCVCEDYEESDSDVSLELENYSSDDEDDITDIDSNISEEEREAQYDEETKVKKHGEPSAASKIQRLPYQVRNVNVYMRKSAEEFVKMHLTNDDLFPQWRRFDYEVLSESESATYMPPLEESCKIRYTNDGDWMTFKRFQAYKDKDILTMFMGACIQSMCWVPSRIDESVQHQQYLSIVTHQDSDIPRHYWHDMPKPQPALLQIWDCGNLVAGMPEFAVGVALDCGVIWALDWCPSGARDVLDDKVPDITHRLGLFAVASANGSAYVFAMPHPSSIKQKGPLFCKLKPVVEMRLATNTNRKVHQATAIKWTTQKGHAHIVVGYSDGTMAYYDLANNSPLLTSTENDVTIVYPFYDERAQSMCIEDVDVFPCSAGGAGVVAAGSVAGASARAAPPAASRAAPAHAAAPRVQFQPHWPAGLLAGDDNLVCQAVNELEWYGPGRRVGSMRACSGCAWCGRVAAAAAPVLRLMRAHPAYNELHRQVIATLQMIPFGNKRKRKNDELAMIMEPLTYNEAIAKYGIEFQRITAKDKQTQQKLSAMPRETFPERFPLSDVTSMQFCPTSRSHHKLAVATHSGLTFIINV